MSILVTGGAGYIGSVVSERLVANGERVVCLDNLSTGNRGAILEGIEFVEGAVLDTSLVESVLRRYAVELIIHCAGSSVIDESMRDPLQYFENNVVGAHALLRAAIGCDVRQFVFSSTAAVYGPPEAVPMSESHPIAPVNPYGRSKRMVEEMLEWHARAYGLRYLSLRYFNAGGASGRFGEHHEPETHLIPIALDVAAGEAERSLRVFGNDYPTPDGTCIRDYIHVEDLADGHARAVDYLRAGGAPLAVNLGSGTGRTVLDVVRAIEQVTGFDVPFQFDRRRPNDPHALVASNELAREVLGWTPARSDIRRIVSDAWEWRKRNPQGYAR